MICPRCQTNNPEIARFCMNCGMDLVRRCSSCQSELPEGARFCMACGQPVLVETATDTSRLSRLTAAVPETLVQKIRSSLESKLRLAPGSLKERRTVTTLLVDVVGSTKLSAQLGADRLMQAIDQAFEIIAPIIYRNEGTIVRILGDTLLAFFGAPVAHEDDPQRAVRAGLEIVDRIKPYSDELKHQYGVDFAMRACINSGPVVIGPVGEDLTYDFSSDGSTVNLTSRIKFARQTMCVLVTAHTYRFIAPYFDCEDLGPLQVKGLPDQLRVYQVKAAKVIPVQVRGFKDISSPMVGREGELATLHQLCEAVQAGLGRAVVIMGEAGLGKTRLIQEWQKAACGEAGENSPAGKTGAGRWVTGRCSSSTQGIAYHLIIDALRNLVGVTAGSEEAEIRANLIQLTSDLLGADWVQVYPFLGRMLSLNLDEESAAKAEISDPQALQTQYLLAVQRLLNACMQRSPLILVLEDLHWADGTSIDLLIKLLPLISDGPILFCLVTRPERSTPGWKLISAARELLGSSLTEIGLNALNEKESRTLVSNLLELDSLPWRVRELVLHKAEGNPYFVEEVIRMLIERGAIVNQNGAWVAQQEISEREIPDNLQGLLLARIDRLPPEARYTLLVASVIGRNFPVRVLSQVMGEV
jgi:class 3 adenylate cyclase